MIPPYQLIRTRRRTLALQVRPGGALIVRAPIFMRDADIEGFILAKRAWIEKTAQRLLGRAEFFPQVRLDPEEKRRHEEHVFMKLTLRCQVFAPRLGVRYLSIGLSNARARWGSCSADGRLRFNWRLALVPDDILDYVVAHELAHIRQQNHSAKFWAAVESVFPDWRRAKRWLRENQGRLTAVR